MAALIALAGLAGAGKTTVANILVEDFGFTRARFAAPLKSMLSELLRHAGANEELVKRLVDGDLKEVPCPLLGDRSPRYAMQTLGTEWGRELIHPELWLLTLERGLSHLLAEDMDVVIDDARFLNEFALARRLGGEVIKVERLGAPAQTHPSERDLFKLSPDATLFNPAPWGDNAQERQAELRAIIHDVMGKWTKAPKRRMN